MHSNFVTPPDYIKSVLIINSTEEQMQDCALRCKEAGVPYNVYFYNEDMAALDWLNQIYERMDQVLSPFDLKLDFLADLTFLTDQGNKILFYGVDQKIQQPADYFNK